MAEFRIRDVEGMRQVCIDINNETVRAARGALSNMSGDINFTPRLPKFADLFRAMFAKESRIRPYFEGSGTIFLQPSLGGYHVFEVQPDERWIMEPRVYWASEGSVSLGISKEPFLAGLLAGDGFFVWKTTISGRGFIAINSPGPVEVLQVKDSSIKVQGRLVLGRTSGLKFKSVKAAPFPRNLISGQSRLRVYEGTGKVLVSWTPYWNEHIYKKMNQGQTITGSIFE